MYYDYYMLGQDDYLIGLYPATMWELGLSRWSAYHQELYDCYLDGFEGYEF